MSYGSEAYGSREDWGFYTAGYSTDVDPVILVVDSKKRNLGESHIQASARLTGASIEVLESGHSATTYIEVSDV